MKNAIARIAAYGHRFLYSGEYDFFQTWGKLSVPHRPTKKEIEVYRKFIGPGVAPGSRFLIFGATPELRDLAAELGVRPVLIDISWGMFTGMLRYTKAARPKDEVWIKSDWRTAALPDNFFDVVLGDIFLRQVKPEEQIILVNKIAKCLRPGGKFVARRHVINPAYLHRPYEEILDEMGNFPYDDKKYEAMGILQYRLFDAGTKNQLVDHKDVVSGVKRYLASGRSSLSYQLFLHEFLEKRLLLFKKQLASQTKDGAERIFTTSFSIADIWRHDGYPEAQFNPIYLLRPKI